MAQIVFQTDQSGANQNICSTAVASTVTFNFSVAANYDAYSANIVMKKASGTTLPVTITIYNQPNGGGSVVGSSTVQASAVTQSFASIEFLFSNITLTAGTSYSLVLSSASSCSGSTPYSFKSGNFQVLDKATLTVINTGYAIASAMTSVATIVSSPKANKKAASILSSSATLTSSALKSKAMNLSSYVVSTLGAVAKMAMSAAAALQARAASSLAASVDREVSCDISASTSLSSDLRTELAATSTIESTTSLVADAEVVKHIVSSHEVLCSVSAEANSNRAVGASLGSSLFVEASLSGAKSLFSVFADLDVRSNTSASASLENEASVEPVACESSLVADVALMAAAMSSMGASCSLGADPGFSGEVGGKKREGSGHYVLNSGAFTLRQWKRFIKASDNHVPKQRGFESKRIDLRAPSLMRWR